jgi:hypothetical protein
LRRDAGRRGARISVTAPPLREHHAREAGVGAARAGGTLSGVISSLLRPSHKLDVRDAEGLGRCSSGPAGIVGC